VRYWVGKSLEVIGLALVGLALLVGIQLHNERMELLYLGLGGGLFTIGWLVEKGKK
jgi:hypothetical protein